MFGFVLINKENYLNLLSSQGINQLIVIALSLILGFFINQLIKTKLTPKLTKLRPCNARLIKSLLPLSVYFCLIIISAIIFEIISYTPILIYSFAVFTLGISLITLIRYLALLPFKENKNIKLYNKILYLILWAVLIIWSINLDSWLAYHADRVFFTFGANKFSIWKLLTASFWLICDLFFMFWLIVLSDNWVKQQAHLDKHTKPLISRTLKIIIIVLGIFVVLPSVGINLTTLSFLGGGLMVGIGLGLQKIASNFISGFILLIDKSVKVGDRIVVNDTTGTITKITTRYVVMQAFNGTEIIIPNEKFITDIVINQTYSNNDIGIDFLVSVAYNTNLNQALELIQKCITQIPEIDSEKSPTIYIKTLNASGIDIFIRVWPKDALNDGILIRNKLHITIVNTFKENEIEIPFPKLDLNILKH